MPDSIGASEEGINKLEIAEKSSNASFCGRCELLVIGRDRTETDWVLQRHKLSEHSVRGREE